MGMRGNENSTFSHLQSEEENQPVSGATYQLLREFRRTVTHSTVIAHQLGSAVSLTLRTSATQKTIKIKAVMNWQNMTTRMGMEAGRMGIINGNGKGMGIKLG